MKIENGVTNFAVYEDATEYYGMAEVTLPEITQISEEVKGAGIAGTFDGTFVGHLEAMSLTLNFRSVTTDATGIGHHLSSTALQGRGNQPESYRKNHRSFRRGGL